MPVFSRGQQYDIVEHLFPQSRLRTLPHVSDTHRVRLERILDGENSGLSAVGKALASRTRSSGRQFESSRYRQKSCLISLSVQRAGSLHKGRIVKHESAVTFAVVAQSLPQFARIQFVA